MKFRIVLVVFALLVASVIAAGAFAATKNAPKPSKSAPPAVGAEVADFTLKTFKGTKVSLNKMLAKGPVLVVFYMGDACPVCNRQLMSFESSYSQFKAKGIQILAVSADKPNLEAKTVARDKISFPIASDPGMKVVKEWGVVMKENPPSASPAYFLIGKNGKIAWEKIGPADDPDKLTAEVLSFNFSKIEMKAN